MQEPEVSAGYSAVTLIFIRADGLAGHRSLQRQKNGKLRKRAVGSGECVMAIRHYNDAPQACWNGPAIVCPALEGSAAMRVRVRVCKGATDSDGSEDNSIQSARALRSPHLGMV